MGIRLFRFLHNRVVFSLFCFLVAPSFFGCSFQGGRLISPQGIQNALPWNAADKEKNLIIKEINRSAHASYHVIHLAGSETPHTHQTHDLTVMILRGSMCIHFGEKKYVLKPGDVLSIPKGTVHWAENTGRQAGEAYAIFVPAFDEKDSHPEK